LRETSNSNLKLAVFLVKKKVGNLGIAKRCFNYLQNGIQQMGKAISTYILRIPASPAPVTLTLTPYDIPIPLINNHICHLLDYSCDLTTIKSTPQRRGNAKLGTSQESKAGTHQVSKLGTCTDDTQIEKRNLHSEGCHKSLSLQQTFKFCLYRRYTSSLVIWRRF
jgi:hypothetical protein